MARSGTWPGCGHSGAFCSRLTGQSTFTRVLLRASGRQAEHQPRMGAQLVANDLSHQVGDSGGVRLNDNFHGAGLRVSTLRLTSESLSGAGALRKLQLRARYSGTDYTTAAGRQSPKTVAAAFVRKPPKPTVVPCPDACQQTASRQF